MSLPEIMQWWERQQLLTDQDREAIERARDLDWSEIDEDWAETELGRQELHNIIISKYHDEEFGAGIQ